MWMPDIMHPSESGDNHTFDALGLCSDMRYNELFDLVVDSNGCNDREAEYEESDEQKKTTRLYSPSGLESANSCGSSAGPGDHQYARSREESWPAPSPGLPLDTPPTKTRIPARYKGQGLSGLSGAVVDLPDLPVRIPASRHRASLSSFTSCSPAKASAAPITAVKNTSTKTTSEASQTNIGNSSIPTDKIHRTLRHRKSARDLLSIRRAQLSELVKTSMTTTKMNNHNQQRHLNSSTPAFDEMLGYSPLQNPLDSIGGVIPSNIPRYAPSDPSPRPSSAHSEYMRSPFSLSAENLHTQYEQVTLARPHSMSSLQSTPAMSDNAMQFSLRRASDPTDSPIFFENQATRPFSLEDYSSWVTTNSMNQQPFDSSVDLSIPTESPAAENDLSQSWWNEGKIDVGDEWARSQQMNGISPRQANNGGSISVVRHYNNGSARRSPYSPIMFLRQPPSPALDEDDSGIFPHNTKRSGSACSSMPSPPESPEFYFPSQMPTPEIGYSSTPSLGQGGFGGIYLHGPSSVDTITRRSSLPHTPSPTARLSAAAAAASAALAATSSKSAPRSISKASSRPGSSRRKASSGSMRSQAKASVASSLSSQSNESEMSFVNFTPHDATRILSGVAPSGSSKTKARREREAQEKRRKLSEAAAAAVMAAGGDASALASVDLL